MTRGLLLTKVPEVRIDRPVRLIYVLCFFASSITNLQIVVAGRVVFALLMIVGSSFSDEIAAWGPLAAVPVGAGRCSFWEESGQLG
jgi:hypothetical protein